MSPSNPTHQKPRIKASEIPNTNSANAHSDGEMFIDRGIACIVTVLSKNYVRPSQLTSRKLHDITAAQLMA